MLNLTDQIIAYEQGELSVAAMCELFAQLCNINGMINTLQGHYGRTAKSLIEAGFLVNRGGRWTVDYTKLDETMF